MRVARGRFRPAERPRDRVGFGVASDLEFGGLRPGEMAEPVFVCDDLVEAAAAAVERERDLESEVHVGAADLSFGADRERATLLRVLVDMVEEEVAMPRPQNVCTYIPANVSTSGRRLSSSPWRLYAPAVASITASVNVHVTTMCSMTSAGRRFGLDVEDVGEVLFGGPHLAEPVAGVPWPHLEVEPETPASLDVIEHIAETWTFTLAVIDATAGAYSLQGLDDNLRARRRDVRRAVHADVLAARDATPPSTT